MRWINVTCNNSRHIIPAQQALFKKYAPSVSVEYIDMKDFPISNWCENVLRRLPDEEPIVFGLDDLLPIDYLDTKVFDYWINKLPETAYDRLELGWGGANAKHTKNCGEYREYSADTLYSVSCQFSIWKVSSLKKILKEVNGSPWDFEKRGRCAAIGLNVPAFRWIEESAVSGRRPGKVNLLGLRKEDIDLLVESGCVNRPDIIYGWKGGTIREDYGKKYSEYY